MFLQHSETTLHMDMLSKWFLIFSVVSLHIMRTVWNKNLLLSRNNISIVLFINYNIVHELSSNWFFIQRCVLARSWNLQREKWISNNISKSFSFWYFPIFQNKISKRCWAVAKDAGIFDISQSFLQPGKAGGPVTSNIFCWKCSIVVSWFKTSAFYPITDFTIYLTLLTFSGTCCSMRRFSSRSFSRIKQSSYWLTQSAISPGSSRVCVSDLDLICIGCLLVEEPSSTESSEKEEISESDGKDSDDGSLSFYFSLLVLVYFL